MNEFLKSIQKEASEQFASGRQSNIGDIVLSAAAVIASVVAAFVGYNAGLPKGWIAFLVVLPALIGTAQRAIDLRGRSVWYFSFSAQLTAIARAVQFENLPVDQASRKWTEAEKAMEERWGQLVKSLPASVAPAPSANKPATPPP